MTISSRSPSYIQTQAQSEQASSFKSKRLVLKGKVSLKDFTAKAQEFQKDLKEIQTLNQNWTNELPDDHPEKATRLEIAKMIEDCFIHKTHNFEIKKLLEDFPEQAQLLQKELKEVKDLNQIWINELPENHPERATRLEVAKMIKDCFIQKTPKFEIEDKKFTSLPESFGKLQHLNEILLTRNGLKTLPQSFSFPHLTHIQIINNKLTAIPESLNDSKKLEVLNFWTNDIKEVPKSWNFPELFWLGLSGNHIKKLPDSLKESKKMKMIILHDNWIEALPESWEFPDLRTLRLSENQLTTLPQNLSLSKKLTRLYIDNNAFVNLSEQKKYSFPELEVLHMNHNNHLEDIPIDLSQSIKLETVKIHGTHINYYSLPENIRNLEKIKIDIDPKNNDIMGRYSINSIIGQFSSHTAIIEDATRHNLGKASTYLSVTEPETNTIISQLIETLEKYLDVDNPDYKHFDKNECHISQERLGKDEAQEGYSIFYKNNQGEIIGGELKSIKTEVTQIIDKVLGDIKNNSLPVTPETSQNLLEKEIEKALKDIIKEDREKDFSSVLGENKDILEKNIKEKIWNKLEENRQNSNNPESIYDITEYYTPTQNHKIKTTLRFLTQDNTHFNSSTPIRLKDEKVTLKQLIAGTLKYLEHPDTQWAEGITEENKKDIIYHNLSDTLYQIQRNDNFLPTNNEIILDDTKEDKPRCHSASINLLTLLYHPFLKLPDTSPSPTDYSTNFVKKAQDFIRNIFSGKMTHNLEYEDIIASSHQKEITPKLWRTLDNNGTQTGIAPWVRKALREDYLVFRPLIEKDTSYPISEKAKILKEETKLWKSISEYYSSINIGDIPLKEALKKGKGRKHKDLPETSEKGEKAVAQDIQDLSQIWIDELSDDHPEKATRLEVAKMIEECFMTDNPHLVLEDKGLTSLPESLKHLQHITYLNLDDNKLTTFPNALSFPNLFDFRANNNKLEIFPEFLLLSPHLDTLILINNSIRMLPDTICDLKNLEIISMNGNNLKKLPDNFSNLSKLWVMDFGVNGLIELPEKFLFPKLKILYLPNNHIPKFPKDLCQSQDLEELDIRDSPLGTLPKEFSFPKLKKLRIHSTDLKQLPLGLANSKDLEYFSAGINNITDYPENFIFPKLKEFHFDQTKITKFPENILKSTELESLHLHNNPNLDPKTLPEGFEKLIHLEELWLGNTITNYFNIPQNIRDKVGIDIDIKPNTQSIQGNESVHTPVIENAKEQNLKNSVTYLPVTEDEANKIIQELIKIFREKLENSQTPDFLPSHEDYDKTTLHTSHEPLRENKGHIVYYKKEGEIIGATLKQVKKEITDIINNMIDNKLDKTQYTSCVVTNIEKAFEELLTEQNQGDIAGLLASFMSVSDNTPSHNIHKRILNKLRQNNPEDIYDKSEYFVPTQTQKLKTALNVLSGENSHFHSPTKREVKNQQITIKQLFAGTVKFIKDSNTVWDDGVKNEDREKIIDDTIIDTLYQMQRNDNLLPTDNYISLDDKEPDKRRCFDGAIILLSTMYQPFIKASISPLPSTADYSNSFIRTTTRILKDVLKNATTESPNYSDIIQSYDQKKITPELWGQANEDGTGTGIAPLVRNNLRTDYDRLNFLTKKTPSNIHLIHPDSEEGTTLKYETRLWDDISNNYEYVDIRDIPLSDSLKKGKKRKHEDLPESSETRTTTFSPSGEGPSSRTPQPPL